MTVPFRPLGVVRDIVQATGLDISYAYDDLVFSDHSVFILRFDDEKPKRLHLHFNSECEPSESTVFTQKLTDAGKSSGFDILKGSKFSLNQIDGKEELEITFLD